MNNPKMPYSIETLLAKATQKWHSPTKRSFMKRKARAKTKTARKANLLRRR